MRESRYRLINRGLSALLSLLLLLSACEASRDDQLDLEDLDGKLMAEQLVIWWNEGISHQLATKRALETRFAGTLFEFKPFYPSPAHLLFPVSGGFPRLLEMMRSEPSPDLIVFDTRFLALLIEAGYLDPVPDAYGLEMDVDTLTEFRSIGPDASLYALPFGRIAEGLYYNKAIFDEMQLPYPTDGMTWDDMMELAISLKSERYRAIEVTDYELLASQLSLRLYDPKSEMTDFESQEWEQLTSILLNINDLVERTTVSPFSVGEAAMFVGPTTALLNYESNLRSHDVDWDIVRFPVFDDERRSQPASRTFAIGVPARATNKEDAFKVMRYLLSHEMQSEYSQRGLASLRSDAEAYIDEFGQSTPLAGKAVSSLFSDAPKGMRDPVFEFVYHMNNELEAIITVDPSDRDTIVETVQRRLSRDIPTLFGERQQFIEEMRSRY